MLTFIKRHLNVLLMALMMVTLAVSYFIHQEQLQQASSTVSLPVEQVTRDGASRLEEYRRQRDETALRFLCRTGLLTGDDLSFVCRQASRAGWGEGSALLLQHAASPAGAKPKRKSYDF